MIHLFHFQGKNDKMIKVREILSALVIACGRFVWHLQNGRLPEFPGELACMVGSLYLVRKKLKSLIHSFISYPNEWFQVELFWRKYNEKLHFRVLFFLLAIVSSPVLKSCWIHLKNNSFLSYCSTWWNELWSETFRTVQNPEPAICRCSPR